MIDRPDGRLEPGDRRRLGMAGHQLGRETHLEQADRPSDDGRDEPFDDDPRADPLVVHRAAGGRVEDLLGNHRHEHQHDDGHQRRPADPRRPPEGVADRPTLLDDHGADEPEEQVEDDPGDDEHRQAHGGADDDDEVGDEQPNPGQRPEDVTKTVAAGVEVLAANGLVKIAREDDRPHQPEDRGDAEGEQRAATREQVRSVLGERLDGSGQQCRRHEQDERDDGYAHEAEPEHALRVVYHERQAEWALSGSVGTRVHRACDGRTSGRVPCDRCAIPAGDGACRNVSVGARVPSVLPAEAGADDGPGIVLFADERLLSSDPRGLGPVHPRGPRVGGVQPEALQARG